MNLKQYDEIVDEVKKRPTCVLGGCQTRVRYVATDMTNFRNSHAT